MKSESQTSPRKYVNLKFLGLGNKPCTTVSRRDIVGSRKIAVRSQSTES
jgi:hypothetical protein